MNNVKRKLLLVCLIFVAITGIVALAIAGQRQGSQGNGGTVKISYNIPDTQGVTVRFNHQTMPSGEQTTYALAPNHYTLTIADAGYMPFTTSFSLGRGDDILINARLKLTTVSDITNITQLKLNGQSMSTLSITNVSYFYDKTWAVLSTQAEGSTYILVAKYAPAAQTWNVILGPGTSFEQSSASGLPTQVANYMKTNNYIIPGA